MRRNLLDFEAIHDCAKCSAPYLIGDTRYGFNTICSSCEAIDKINPDSLWSKVRFAWDDFCETWNHIKVPKP